MGQPPLSVVECGHAIRILEWNQFVPNYFNSSVRVVCELSLTELNYAKSRAGGCVYCGRSPCIPSCQAIKSMLDSAQRAAHLQSVNATILALLNRLCLKIIQSKTIGEIN
ncbi:hypothetical protein Y032_1005g3365 [Ancylostoma ceylanicum]|nr:hypothetical protein Y032_1005g3365 [Ancylostoma ceylanicum]